MNSLLFSVILISSLFLIGFVIYIYLQPDNGPDSANSEIEIKCEYTAQPLSECNDDTNCPSGYSCSNKTCLPWRDHIFVRRQNIYDKIAYLKCDDLTYTPNDDLNSQCKLDGEEVVCFDNNDEWSGNIPVSDAVLKFYDSSTYLIKTEKDGTETCTEAEADANIMDNCSSDSSSYWLAYRYCEGGDDVCAVNGSDGCPVNEGNWKLNGPCYPNLKEITKTTGDGLQKCNDYKNKNIDKISQNPICGGD